MTTPSPRPANDDQLPQDDQQPEHDQQPEDDQQPEPVQTRAELLPEELAAGSDDPVSQAQAVLADSQERTEVPNAAPTTHLERRSSDEAQ